MRTFKFYALISHFLNGILKVSYFYRNYEVGITFFIVSLYRDQIQGSFHDLLFRDHIIVWSLASSKIIFYKTFRITKNILKYFLYYNQFVCFLFQPLLWKSKSIQKTVEFFFISHKESSSIFVSKCFVILRLVIIIPMLLLQCYSNSVSQIDNKISIKLDISLFFASWIKILFSIIRFKNKNLLAACKRRCQFESKNNCIYCIVK